MSINKYMELACPDSIKFIEGIYAFLRKAGVCFLNGAFVTDDPDGTLFSTLLSGNAEQSGEGAVCHNIRTDRPVGTHLNFMYDDYHEEERRKNKFMSKRHRVVNPELPSVQYEKIIKPRLDHLCDPGAIDPKTEDFKGVIMFYPFILDNEQKFLYFKLEGYPARHYKHAIQAVKRYGLGIKKKDPYPKRRQDDELKHDTAHYPQDIAAIVSVLLHERANQHIVDTIQSKMQYYNEKIRTADEMYLPVELFHYIFKVKVKSTQQGSPNRFRSVAMTVLAAARTAMTNPVVGSLSWAYNMKVSPFSDEEHCLTATYSDEDELREWTRDQLYWLAKGIGLHVNRHMNKASLCHEITNPEPNLAGLRPLNTMELQGLVASNPHIQAREGKPYMTLTSRKSSSQDNDVNHDDDDSDLESSTDPVTPIRRRPAMKKKKLNRSSIGG